MLKLYHSAQSRSTRPRWLLEEIGAPYELVRVDLSKQEHKTPQYLQIHPHGVGSGAGRRRPGTDRVGRDLRLSGRQVSRRAPGPAVGTPERGTLLSMDVLHHGDTRTAVDAGVHAHGDAAGGAAFGESAAEEGRKKFGEVAEVIEQRPAGKPFLLGDQFSAADVMLGSTIAWAQMLGLLTEWPTVAEYAQRLSSRPAFQRASPTDRRCAVVGADGQRPTAARGTDQARARLRRAAQLARQREGDVLLGGGEVAHAREAEAAQMGDRLLHERLRRRRAGGEADRAHAVEPGRIDVARMLDQPRVAVPALRATSTRRLALLEVGEPITSTRSLCRASSFTAVCRFCVA